MIVKMIFLNALKQKLYFSVYEFSESKKYRLEFHKCFKLSVRADAKHPESQIMLN